MITSQQLVKRYGIPGQKTEGSYMAVWKVDADITQAIHTIPQKIYTHRLMILHLQTAFRNVIKRGLADQIKAWDGCYQVRNKRGLSSWSLHAWGLAIDINAAWNPLGKKPTISPELVKCFTDAGFIWGGLWSRPDGMHFELAVLGE